MARPFTFRHAGLAARPTRGEYVADTRTADCWWNSGQKWALTLRLAVSYVPHVGEQPLADKPPVVPTLVAVFYCPLNSTRSGVHFGPLTRLPSVSPSNGHAEIATRQSIRAFSAIYSPALVAAG